MGLQLISSPQGTNETPGPLNLPSTFDRNRFAAKWVKEGQQVAAASVRESIPGTKITADGWTVWKDEDDKPCKVPLQNGNYVLLFRDKAVQDGVNAICGNVGKQRMLAEHRGETTGGLPTNDPGLLSDEKLKRAGYREPDEEEGEVILNEVPDVERDQVEAPTLVTKTSRRPNRR